MASVFNEYALKSQYDTSIYLQVVLILFFYYVFYINSPIFLINGRESLTFMRNATESNIILLYTVVDFQNLFLYGYGAIFNFLGILGTVVIKGTN